MAMPTSTANWHWKNKNCTAWARGWFERELPTLGAEDGVRVLRVDEVDGDVELGQRKSKLITIYDCKVVLAWAGTAADGTDVAGTLTIPEVSHEIGCDGLSEYVYEWTLTTARAPAVEALFARAKKELPPLLAAKLNAFPAALLDTHGKDLYVAGAGSAPGSGASTPLPTKTAAASAPAPAAKAEKEKAKAVNTSAVKASATFQAEAHDLFSLLTDPARIPMWTRAAASGAPRAGERYTLFGGGVRGAYVALEPGKQIVQSWALQSPTWPAGHEATLTTTLEQLPDATKVTFALAGVPKGMEDEIQRNIEGYYVHGLKSIGYVQLLVSEPEPARGPVEVELDAPRPPGLSYVAGGLAALVLLGAVVPYFLS